MNRKLRILRHLGPDEYPEALVWGYVPGKGAYYGVMVMPLISEEHQTQLTACHECFELLVDEYGARATVSHINTRMGQGYLLVPAKNLEEEKLRWCVTSRRYTPQRVEFEDLLIHLAELPGGLYTRGYIQRRGEEPSSVNSNLLIQALDDDTISVETSSGPRLSCVNNKQVVTFYKNYSTWPQGGVVADFADGTVCEFQMLVPL